MRSPVPSAARLCALLALLATLAVAPPALAARGQAVIAECESYGYIEDPTRYRDADYREALEELPGDVDEYTDCRAVIERARQDALEARQAAREGRAAPGGTSGGGLPGGAPPPPPPGAEGLSGGARVQATPEEDGELRRTRDGAEPPEANVGGVPVRPAPTTLDLASVTSTLPLPVVVLLVLLALLAALAGGRAARDRVRARRAG